MRSSYQSREPLSHLITISPNQINHPWFYKKVWLFSPVLFGFDRKRVKCTFLKKVLPFLIAEILVVARQSHWGYGSHQHHDLHARQRQRLRPLGRSGKCGLVLPRCFTLFRQIGEHASSKLSPRYVMTKNFPSVFLETWYVVSLVVEFKKEIEFQHQERHSGECG